MNLEVYNDQLTGYGNRIHLKRDEFLEKFIPIFNVKYQMISDDNEQVKPFLQESITRHIICGASQQKSGKG